MLVIHYAFLWSAQNVPKSVYGKSLILTSPVPRKVDNCVLKLATSSGRNSHGKSRLYTGIVTHSRHRVLVHDVMTLATLPEVLIRGASSSLKWEGEGVSSDPQTSSLRPRSWVDKLARSTGHSWIASYTNSYTPPIPVLNIVVKFKWHKR